MSRVVWVECDEKAQVVSLVVFVLLLALGVSTARAQTLCSSLCYSIDFTPTLMPTIKLVVIGASGVGKTSFRTQVCTLQITRKSKSRARLAVYFGSFFYGLQGHHWR